MCEYNIYTDMQKLVHIHVHVFLHSFRSPRDIPSSSELLLEASGVCPLSVQVMVTFITLQFLEGRSISTDKVPSIHVMHN